MTNWLTWPRRLRSPTVLLEVQESQYYSISANSKAREPKEPMVLSRSLRLKVQEPGAPRLRAK